MYRCPMCGSELHWQCDYDAVDVGYEFEGVVNCCSCSRCDLDVDCVTNFEVDELTVVLRKKDIDDI